MWVCQRKGLCILAAVVAVTVSPPARADPSDQDSALALKLFDEGRVLLTAGNVAEACRKLEESWRLHPLPGTLLNLAVCNEQEGRMASAVAEFRQARALAERDGRYDRLALVNQHLRAIEGKVSSLVIVVAADADRPDLSVARDGTAVRRVVWGSRIPTDPGEHVVEASAPNKKPWKATVRVLADGDVQTVTIDPLEDEAPQPAPAPPQPATQPPATQPPALQPAAAAPIEPHHAMSTRKILGLVAAASGVVSIGVGSYFGLLAIERKRNSTCTVPCSQQSFSLNARAGTAADISTGAFAFGLAALGVGAVLWFGDSSGRSGRPFASVAPSFEPGSAGVDLVGRF